MNSNLTSKLWCHMFWIMRMISGLSKIRTANFEIFSFSKGSGIFFTPLVLPVCQKVWKPLTRAFALATVVFLIYFLGDNSENWMTMTPLKSVPKCTGSWLFNFFEFFHALNNNDTHWISGSLLFKSSLPPFINETSSHSTPKPHLSGAPHLLLFCYWNTSVCLPVAVVMPFCTRNCLYNIYVYILDI